MRTTTTFALILATSLAACGGDDGGSVTPIDAKRIDAAGGPDAAQLACNISGPTFTVNSTAANMTRRPQSTMTPNPNVYFLGLGGFIESGTPADAVFVQFWPGGEGIAPGEVLPGTFDLSVAGQKSLDSCGVCVLISSNFVNGTGGDGDYMPTAGTLTINSITPTIGGTYSFTMTGVMLQHVVIDDMTGVTTPAPDAATCKTSISGTLSGSIVAPAKMAGPQLESPTMAKVLALRGNR